jgi:hypothetical protein
VLVLDQVFDKSLTCLGVKLIGGIADTGAIRNEFLRIANAHISKFVSGLGVTE